MSTPQHQPTAFPAPTDLRAVRAWLAVRRPDPSAVRAWAQPLLAVANRHGPIPDLGSPEWAALPDGDPRKLAALITAALARLDESTPAAIADRLRRELDEIDAVCLRRLRMASHDVSAAIDRAAVGPTHAELVRRRNTFPCLTCRRASVLHPQTVCQACQQTSEVAA